MTFVNTMKKKIFPILMLGILVLSFLSANICASEGRTMESGEGDYYPATEPDTYYTAGDWAVILLGIIAAVFLVSFLVLVFNYRGVKNKDKIQDRLFSISMIFVIIALVAIVANSLWV